MVSQQSVPPQEPLKRLHVMINVVLIETGRLVSDPAKHTPQAITLTNTKLKNLFPQALNRFHEALDELEEELGQARAVLQRDLAVNLAEQARREQAKTIKEEQKQPVEEADAVALATLGDAQKQDTDMTDTVKRVEKPDVTMTDLDSTTKNEEQELAKSIDTNEIQKPSLDTSTEVFNKKNSPAKAATEEKRNNASYDGSADDPDKSSSQAQDQLDHELFDKTPTTAGMKDIDFDKLFEDGDDQTNDDANDNNKKNSSNNNVENNNPILDPSQATKPTTDLNLSPSKPETTTTTTTVSAPAATTMTTATTATSINPATSNASATETAVSSFLPGLESYANTVSLSDGGTADIPLDLDFLNAPLTTDDLNSNNQTNVNDKSNNNSSNNNEIASLDLLSQFPIGIDANSNNTTTGNQNSSNENANGNPGMLANSEALNQASLDDLFGFTDGTGMDGVVGGGGVGVGVGEGGASAATGVSNTFDIGGLADFGDLLGNDGMRIDLGSGEGGVNVAGTGTGTDNGSGNNDINNNNNNNNNINNSTGNENQNPDTNADTNLNLNLNGNGDTDLMLSEFDDMFNGL